MPLLEFIAFLSSLAIPAGIAVLASRAATRDLRQRVQRLEVLLAALDKQMFDLAVRAARQERPGPPPAAKPTPPSAPEPTSAGTTAEPTAAPPSAPEPTPGAEPPRTSSWSSVPIAPAGLPATAPAAPRQSLEERLGAHWAVYAGGLALALGGIFLVRYSIEAGLLGPGVRIVLGALLAAALLAGGEWVRRNDPVVAQVGKAAPHIPSILTAAGTIVAFADIYAAHALYQFIGSATAFVLLGLVGIVAMLAAAIHGPALAGLGLAGSYVTPLLVTSSAPNPWPVVVFFTVVAGTAHVLARTRRWLWLAAVATGGAVVWGFLLLGRAHGLPTSQSWIWAAMVHTVLQAALASTLVAVSPHLDRDDAASEPDWIASGILAAFTVLAVAVIGSSPFGDAGWWLFVVAMIGLLGATQWTSAPAAAAAVLAGVVAIAAMLAWPGLRAPIDRSLMDPMLADVLRLPENVGNFIAYTIVATLAVAVLAMLRLWRSPVLPTRTAGFYALAVTATPLLGLVLAYLRVTQFDTSMRFGLAGVVLAAGFAFLAESFQRRADKNPQAADRLAAGAFAAAAIAAISLALVMTLERGYLTVAFALAAFGTAYVATLRDIPLLRYAVAALGLVVLGRIVWDPRIMGADVGRLPLFNWLLVGYGVPALAFGGAARLMRARGDDLAVRLADALSVIFVALLAFFQIHHWSSGGDLSRPVSGHVEAGLMALVSLGLTHALTRMDLARANVVFRHGSTAFAAISGLLIVLALGIGLNPYFAGDGVSGGTPFSSLVPGYLLPGIAALYVARHARGVRPTWYVTAASVLGLLLVFGYVTLEVRHAFHGPLIGYWHRSSGPERWATTVAWLTLAVGLLAYGWWRHSVEARVASAALVLLTALKLVFIDLQGASGLWRALSFICLGAVLIGIGLAYQRLIFARPAKPSSGGETQSGSH